MTNKTILDKYELNSIDSNLQITACSWSAKNRIYFPSVKKM